MSNEKISIRPVNIITLTVRARKAKDVNSRSFYLPITKEMIEQFHFSEDEVITFGILKREIPVTEPIPERPIEGEKV